MEQKRILVCSHWLEIGGAERALIGLLQQLSLSNHKVDLFLCRHSGELLPFIPENITLLDEDPCAASIAVPIRQTVRNGQYRVALGRLLSKIHAAFYLHRHPSDKSNVAIEYSHKYTHKSVSHVGDKRPYDLVISFQEPHYISAYRTSGRVKIAWMHTDYQTISVDVQEGMRIWSQFDYIAAISSRCAESFLKTFPGLKDKIVQIENIIPESIVRQQSREFDAEYAMPADGSIRLLSVGRYCTAKNFDNVPDICSRLIRAGLNIKWYIIGFGADEDLIRRKIEEAGMQEHVILLGKKENPYPYIAACDLYVQPSRYEGNCVTVHEAQMLGKPVVITRYGTSASQLEEGVDGVIVPLDNEGCAAGIAQLLKDPERMQQLSENCLQRDYSNAGEVQKLYDMME